MEQSHSRWRRMNEGSNPYSSRSPRRRDTTDEQFSVRRGRNRHHESSFKVDRDRRKSDNTRNEFYRQNNRSRARSSYFRGVSDWQRVRSRSPRSPSVRHSRSRNEIPLDNFRTVSILPTNDDLVTEPFLRENTLRYESVTDYCDMMFRLYREDFIRPLREGISEYRNCFETGKDMKNNDVYIYENTSISIPDVPSSGLTYQIQFGLDGSKAVCLEPSKRLIYGSLVCLSSDRFQTTLFAVVHNNDKLKLGKIDVQVESVDEIDFRVQYTMIESSAYFESYRYVLRSLQQIREEKFNFKKYLLGGTVMLKTENNFFLDLENNQCSGLKISIPSYLLNGDGYDVSPIMKNGFKRFVDPFLIEFKECWPHPYETSLNPSQYEAVRCALTNELAIIQGPPGTGKTFIGLKIAEVLLLNMKFWNNSEDDGPILVLSFNNHALDQFMEGILQFTDKIVRVGSKSKSSVLEDYNLSKIRKKKGELPKDFQMKMREAVGSLRGHEEEMKKINGRIEALEKDGLFSENVLHHFMGQALKQLLQQYTSFERKSASFIQEWLGLGLNALNVYNEFSKELDRDKDYRKKAEKIETGMNQIYEDADKENNERKSTLNDLAMKRKRASEAGLIDLTSNVTKDNVIWSFSRKETYRRKETVLTELRKNSLMLSKKERKTAEGNPWSLPMSDRWKLYRTWLQDYRNCLQKERNSVREKLHTSARRLEELKEIQDVFFLQRADVVGMTTTCAARHNSVVKKINSPIMIVEEAAEVFEAHIVASLTESCKHLILIGDHQQLRPKPTVYELGLKYHLDVSLFERLIKLGLPYSQLNIQHRMLPAISKLLVPHIYKKLFDHDSVKQYPQIKGVCSNVFFIDHENRETIVHEGRSKVNEHEVDFLVELCKYLLHQGYHQEKITILTTYKEQMFVFKRKMSEPTLEDVQVTTVDNYQGEENDIILLSLVRSNQEGNIGFLSTDNRVCVALSRARHALYCIGNFGQLADRSSLWRKIAFHLHSRNMIGDGLTLISSCKHQTKYEKKVSSGKDISDNFTEGGCNELCAAKLQCGHVCPLPCHTDVEKHQNLVCRSQCGRLCGQGLHTCQEPCHQECEPCQEEMKKTIPGCGHSQMVPCSMDPQQFICKEDCDKVRECGHKCKMFCGIDCSDSSDTRTRCYIQVEFRLLCGHSVKVSCHETDLTMKLECQAQCEMVLDCGHQCPGLCHECEASEGHRDCGHVCGQTLVCGHLCQEKCGHPCYCLCFTY